MQNKLRKIFQVFLMMSLLHTIPAGEVLGQDKTTKATSDRNHKKITISTKTCSKVKSKIKKPKKQIKAKVTAYTKKELKKPFKTASGLKVKPGMVAVSPNLLKKGWSFGKRVLIDGNEYIIQDILPSRKNGFDIYMLSQKEAIKFGSQKLDIILLD